LVQHPVDEALETRAGDHHALRLAGASRGEDHVEGISTAGTPRRRWVVAVRELPNALRREDEAGACGGDGLLDPRARKATVERHVGDPGLGDPEEADEHLRLLVADD